MRTSPISPQVFYTCSSVVEHPTNRRFPSFVCRRSRKKNMHWHCVKPASERACLHDPSFRAELTFFFFFFFFFCLFDGLCWERETAYSLVFPSIRDESLGSDTIPPFCVHVTGSRGKRSSDGKSGNTAFESSSSGN